MVSPGSGAAGAPAVLEVAPEQTDGSVGPSVLRDPGRPEGSRPSCAEGRVRAEATRGEAVRGASLCWRAAAGSRWRRGVKEGRRVKARWGR